MSAMGRHREVRRSPSGRRVAPRTRPRYRRLSAAGGALLVTLVAVLGGMGVLPADQSAVAAAGQPHHGNAQPLPNSDASDDGTIRLTDAAPTAGARGDQATGKV